MAGGLCAGAQPQIALLVAAVDAKAGGVDIAAGAARRARDVAAAIAAEDADRDILVRLEVDAADHRDAANLCLCTIAVALAPVARALRSRPDLDAVAGALAQPL